MEKMQNNLMLRYCIHCKEIFGCANNGIRKVCQWCPRRNFCIIRKTYFNNPPENLITASICPVCWRQYQVRKPHPKFYPL